MTIARPLAPPATESVSVPLKRFSGAAGRRLFIYGLCGLAWVIPALWNSTFVFAILIWDLILLVAFIFDWLRVPGPGQVRIRREWQNALSAGVPCQLVLTVINDSDTPIRARLLNNLPASRFHEPKTLSVSVPPRGMGSVSLEYTPSERGDVEAGPVYLRYTSVFEMAEKWAKADLHQKVRVYPSFEHAKKHAVYLARSRQIELQMRLMRLRGLGSNFESLREFRDGDELRNVCWTATARRGKLVTKTYQVERSQAVWLVLDCGRLMRARIQGFSKLDRAVDAALCVAQLALYSGDRVGLLAYGRTVTRRVMPGRGATQLRHLVEQLAVVQEEVPEADHLRAATTLLGLQKSRSLVVWITDLAETAMTPEVIEAASHLLSRHVVLFIVIEQTEIRKRAAVAPKSAHDMYEVVAAQEVTYRRDLLLGRLRQRGALCVEVEPMTLSGAVLNQYLRVKERNLV